MVCYNVNPVVVFIKGSMEVASLHCVVFTELSSIVVMPKSNSIDAGQYYQCVVDTSLSFQIISV